MNEHKLLYQILSFSQRDVYCTAIELLQNVRLPVSIPGLTCLTCLPFLKKRPFSFPFRNANQNVWGLFDEQGNLSRRSLELTQHFPWRSIEKPRIKIANWESKPLCQPSSVPTRMIYPSIIYFSPILKGQQYTSSWYGHCY